MKNIMNKLIKSILFAMAMIATTMAGAQIEKDQTLNERQKAIVNISSLTAVGDLINLKPALVSGLDAGLTVNEIKEVLMHLYAYCGFPRSLRGIQTFMEVLNERKAKGIDDKVGRTATPITDKRTKYERGKENLAKLSGVRPDGPPTGYAAFAPEIEVFLKEHLFADLFDRDVLTFIERELVTVSVNSSIGGVEPMVRSHMSISLNIGITPNQLKELVSVVEQNVGVTKGNAAKITLIELLKSKGLDTADINLTEEKSPTNIFPKGDLATNGNFHGSAWVHSLVEGDSLNANAVGSVTFEPGARTKWHLHPSGQIILALEGEGYYQEKGSSKIVLKKGDVVKCPPNVPHWHGASKNSQFIQVAITSRNQGGTKWLEAVTEEQYNSEIKP
jgi:4-carboxymuconolactone decarboxylase